jgi:hypothetical protein
MLSGRPARSTALGGPAGAGPGNAFDVFWD